MDYGNKNRIQQLLNSEAINYLETSERLILKNILEKNTISKIELDNLEKIFKKYGKYLKN
jgi:hypothetical protein|tara:strand:+ start:1357 stop:1536 length:180 start_codon:yes stop_codon:yes gene_type:complete